VESPNVTCAHEKDKGIITTNIISSNNKENTPRTQVTFGTHSLGQWDQPSKDLINWFITTPKIKEPFCLDQHRRVCNPEKFYNSIMHDIQAGPSAPRNKHGVLIDDLKKLKIVMNGYNTD
jgi:hypothetical protein